MKNLFFALALSSTFFSFASTANLKGVVTEKDGTPMPYVIVELSQKATKIKSTATDTKGAYILYDLPTGIYDISFKYLGFQPYLNSNIKIDASSTVTLNVQLNEVIKLIKEVEVTSTKELENKPVTIVSGSIDAEKTKYYGLSITQEDISTMSATGYKYTTAANQLIAGRKNTYDVYDKADFDIEKSPKEPISNNEDYANLIENKFISASENAISTFSIDVDNASYSNVRRIINSGNMPPKDAVRIEEMINYFKYDYKNPTGEDPFSVNTEMMNCPWNPTHKILMLGMQGKQIDYDQINPSNLVFLIDVSGSMSDANKLPLVKQSLKILVDNLQPNDKIALVVYAGSAGLVLPSTEVRNKASILAAIDNLQSGGSTAGGAGIKLAYKIAEENLIVGGNNRVVMCTDGDFNVGLSGDNEMKKLIEGEREKKIYISMIGFGMGNYKDSKMETIADNGNGNYYYIDNISEANKVFKTDMKATLFTIAKDVKLQLYFNPERIESYRLIGYENRILAKEDFDNDQKDAGELGAGHTVTALYEIVLKSDLDKAERINNELAKELAKEEINFNNDDYLILKMRYKKPSETSSKLLLEHLGNNNIVQNTSPSNNIQFATSVAWFGMLLRGSNYANKTSYIDVLTMADASKGNDKEGYRKEFIELVKNVNLLAKK